MRNSNSITAPLFIATMSLSLMACSQTKPDQSGHATHKHQATTEEKAANTQTSVSSIQAQNILTAYLEIKNALVKTDGNLAGNAATKLIGDLGEMKEKLITEIRFDARHIEETKNPDHQRNHFNSLSDNIYTLVKLTTANEVTLYRQYCPMAMHHKGAYWLSTEKEVNNPYFGDKMLHCGSTKETLTALE